MVSATKQPLETRHSRAGALLSGIFSDEALKALRHQVERETLSANSTTGCRNMFRISRMQEILKGLPRGAFDRLVSEHQADKYSKGFGCWDQLVAMLYGHLSGAESLRQLEAPPQPSLSSGYRSRPPFDAGRSQWSPRGRVLSRRPACEGQASRQLRRESQELLYLLDSTSITLKGPGFDAWTQGNSTRNTQGIKLHLLYAAHEQIPLQHSFTAANVNDVSEGIKLPIERGATYVFDKGYATTTGGPTLMPSSSLRHPLQIQRCPARDTSRPIAAADRDTILEDQIVRFAYRHQAVEAQSLREATPAHRRRSA